MIVWWNLVTSLFCVLLNLCFCLKCYQRSYLHTRSRGRRLRRTWGLLPNQWEHESLSPPACRPSQNQRMSQTSGAQHCKPSQQESSKHGPPAFTPGGTTQNISVFSFHMFKVKLVVFINFDFLSLKSYVEIVFIFFCRTSRFASFPEYLIVQIKKFTFGVDWVPKKLGKRLSRFN